MNICIHAAASSLGSRVTEIPAVLRCLFLCQKKSCADTASLSSSSAHLVFSNTHTHALPAQCFHSHHHYQCYNLRPKLKF